MSNPIEDIKAMVFILKRAEPDCKHSNATKDEEDGLIFLDCPDCGYNLIYPKELDDISTP